MRTLRTMEPGQRGTEDLLARYGVTLLYARYRCDEATGEGWRTVELVVRRSCPTCEAERPGSRRLCAQAEGGARRRVALRIGWRERDLQRRVTATGGRWEPDRRVWLSKARRRGTAGSSALRRRWGFLDLGTRCLDVVETLGVDRCRYGVDKCRHRFLDLGTARRSVIG